MCNQWSKTIKFVIQGHEREKSNWVHDVFSFHWFVFFLCSDKSSVLSTLTCFCGATPSSEVFGGVWLVFIRWCYGGEANLSDWVSYSSQQASNKRKKQPQEVDSENKHQCWIREASEVRTRCPLIEGALLFTHTWSSALQWKSLSDGSVIPDHSDDRDERLETSHTPPRETSEEGGKLCSNIPRLDKQNPCLNEKKTQT